jgi:hypothetical protein
MELEENHNSWPKLCQSTERNGNGADEMHDFAPFVFYVKTL